MNKTALSSKPKLLEKLKQKIKKRIFFTVLHTHTKMALPSLHFFQYGLWTAECMMLGRGKITGLAGGPS